MRFQKDSHAIQAALAKGKDLPAWLDDEPILSYFGNFCLAAFDDLSTCRHDGGFIPWSAIVLYSQHRRLDPDLAEGFVRVIRGADERYLGYIERERDKKRAAENRPPKRRR